MNYDKTEWVSFDKSAATLCPDHTKKYLIHVSENVFFLNNSCAELYI